MVKRSGLRIPALGICLCAASACAPALPVLSGGGITPERRVDLVAGGAARAPVGELRAKARRDQPLGSAQPGGMSPLIGARVATFADVDMGLRASATSVEIAGRRGFKISRTFSLIGGVAPYVGWLPPKYRETDRTGHGVSLGLYSPWAAAFSLGGIYEAWAGLRVGCEHAAGSLAANSGKIDLRVDGVRTGAIAGFGLGFRRLWALVELAADYEWWRVELDGAPSSPHGVALTPSFALRLRL